MRSARGRARFRRRLHVSKAAHAAIEVLNRACRTAVAVSGRTGSATLRGLLRCPPARSFVFFLPLGSGGPEPRTFNVRLLVGLACLFHERLPWKFCLVRATVMNSAWRPGVMSQDSASPWRGLTPVVVWHSAAVLGSFVSLASPLLRWPPARRNWHG